MVNVVVVEKMELKIGTWNVAESLILGVWIRDLVIPPTAVHMLL